MFTYTKILVPLDGSELAERALIPALQIAQATGAQISLLRVATPLFLALDPLVYDQMNQQGEDEAAAYLRSLCAEKIPPGISVSLATQSGPVAHLILQYAQDNGCNLIIMSSHGRSGVGRWVYGSIADKVLRGACCSVLIIRAQVETTAFTHHRLLVPLDGSLLAEKALEPALALAQAMAMELILLRAVNPVHLSLETQTMKQQADYLEDRELAEAESYMQQIHASLAKQHASLQTIIARAEAADAIIDFSETQPLDIIIMSSHGRSGISRWLYGSVTEKVLRGAPCATMVIRDGESRG